MTHIKQDYKHLEEKSEHFGHVVYGWADLIDGVQFLNEHNAQLISAKELVQAQLAIRKKIFDTKQRLTTLEEAFAHEDVCVAEAVVYIPHNRAAFLRKSPILDKWSDEGKNFTYGRSWLEKSDKEHELRCPWKADEYFREALELEKSNQDSAMRDFFIAKEFQPFTLCTSSNLSYDNNEAYKHPLIRWLCQELQEQAWTSESFSDLHRFYGHSWLNVNLLDKTYIDQQEKPFLKQIAISKLREKYTSDPFAHIYCDVPQDKTLLFVGKIKEKEGGNT